MICFSNILRYKLIRSKADRYAVSVASMGSMVKDQLLFMAEWSIMEVGIRKRGFARDFKVANCNLIQYYTHYTDNFAVWIIKIGQFWAELLPKSLQVITI